MANQFKYEILKISVAEICQTIGFQGIYSTPLDVLADILHRYIFEVCKLTHRYTEHFGRSEPNLDDLGLAFLDMGISVGELEEYVNNVDCPPFPHTVPKIPVPRTSNLNFLKPGAREILSRPIHIHEHLPPMYPEKEEEEVDMKVNTSLDDVLGEGSSSPMASPQPAAKRSSDSDVSPAKKPKYSLDDEGQPVREIVSVMMTTSGFISSAREGKLPESKVPNIPMATPRSSSPSAASALSKKKLAVEKLIRQKNNQGGPQKPPPSKSRPAKDKGPSKPGSKPMKVLKIPKMPKIPKIPQVKPGSSMPQPSPANTPLAASTPGPPVSQGAAAPLPTPPKLKMPTPKIRVPKPPKTPKSETKKGSSTPKAKDTNKDSETKKSKKEKDAAKKKENGKDKEVGKKGKESKKEKEGKKEKEPKKEKESKKENKKEKEKERERERELILALAASADVTVTSIPPPAKAQDAPPDKLSIFKKIKPKGEAKEADRTGEREVHPSRDSSPDLMIDENPRMAQRRPPEDLAVLDNPVPALDASMDELDCSPGDFPSYQDDMSPPGTPSTPRTPELPQLAVRKTPEKWKGKERGRERRPKKDRSKSPKCGFSPGRREHSASESETPDRPKTPEVGLPLDSLGPPSTSTPFSLPPFPNAPGFIPPFSRFPFIPPYGGPPIRPGIPPIPDLRLPPHTFLHRLPAPGSKRPLDDDHLGLDEPEPLERPLTPRHDRDFSPLPPPGHPSPLRSPSPTQSSATPPRPRTPAHHSPPPLIKVKPEKPEKSEKEKKKEHKKEKKEKDKDKDKDKEKDKDKAKKKKDKKDKDKEKDKLDKKKEKEKMKTEKKEKKKCKKEKEEAAPRLTMKLGGASSPMRTPASQAPAAEASTPKLVIKSVNKHEEDSGPSKSSSSSGGSQDDQPGSPEIAKFSALITRPPRSQQKKGESPPVVPILKIKEVQSAASKQKEAKETAQGQPKAKEAKDVPPLKIKTPTPTPAKGPSTPKAAPTPKTPAATPKMPEEKKSPGSKKVREKKEKKEKKAKELKSAGPAMPGGAGPSSMPASSLDVALNPQVPAVPPPIMSPPIDTPKSSKKQEQSTGLLTETVGPIGHFVDDQGNEVWICPTCGKQDDGSPMIGCDTCNDWYHWVCVGIQVPPNDDVNWYCPRCLSQHKQRGAPPDKKKRGRKKK